MVSGESGAHGLNVVGHVELVWPTDRDTVTIQGNSYNKQLFTLSSLYKKTSDFYFKKYAIIYNVLFSFLTVLSFCLIIFILTL